MLSRAIRAYLPRLAIFLLWLFTDRMTLAFTSGWLGFFGFLFLPWTTLAWTICYAPLFGVSGFGYFVVLFSSCSTSRRTRAARTSTAISARR